MGTGEPADHDDATPDELPAPWDLADQLDEVERQIARQADRYEQARAAIAEAGFPVPPEKPRDQR